MAAIIPLIRIIIFTLITLLSLVVFGLCVHIEYLVSGDTDVYLSFAPLGLGVACLTASSLSLFRGLSTLRRRVFTSFIAFEIFWFFVLWVLWVGTAVDTLVDRAYYFPDGCAYNDYPTVNQICYEFTVVEALAFLGFFAAFIYYDVVFLYAIIHAVRGRAVWTASVKEAAGNVFSGAGNHASVAQPRQFNAAAAPLPVVHYDVFSADIALTQPYNVYAPQVPRPPPAAPPYPHQVLSQGATVQQDEAYPQRRASLPLPPHSLPRAYGYDLASAVHKQGSDDHAGYSPSLAASDVPLPSLPSYTSYPVIGGSLTEPLPLPSGYQERPVPSPQPSSSPYDGARQVAAPPV